MKTRELAELLKVLRRAKVAKFQMDRTTIAIEFIKAAPPPGEATAAIGFNVEQEDPEED